MFALKPFQETAVSKLKNEFLSLWKLPNQNTPLGLKGKKGFDGGIAVQDGPNGWKINRNAKYSFDSSMKGWEVFELK